jgi:hypothetical protein
MATVPRTPQGVPPGHGTDALGPSDISDSGSDVVGGPGLGGAADGIGLDRGTNQDGTLGRDALGTAGADLGDANLDSDSDSVGTGEHATVGRDVDQPGSDLGTDRVVDADDPSLGLTDGPMTPDGRTLPDDATRQGGEKA